MARQRRKKGDGSLYVTTHHDREEWCAAWWQNGKRHRAYGATPTEALDRKTALIARLGKPQPAPRRKTLGTAQNPTTEQVMERWLAHNTRLGETSRKKYRSNLELHVLPYLGRLPIKRVHEAQIEEAFDRLQAKKTGSSAIWHTWRTLSTMLNYAVRSRIIRENPMTHMDPPRRTNKIAVLDEEFIDEHTTTVMGIIGWIGNPDNEWHRFYPLVMAMNLGLRRAEVLGITREALDMGRDALMVATQLKQRAGGPYLTPKTKNGKGRLIPLPHIHDLALMEAYRQSSEAPTLNVEDEDGTVLSRLHPLFIREDGRPYSYNNLHDIWENIQTAYARHVYGQSYKLQPEEHIRLHGNRHIAASVLARQGVSLQIIQAILGHLTPAMTEHYTHTTNGGLREAAERWDKATEQETAVATFVYGELAKGNEGK